MEEYCVSYVLANLSPTYLLLQDFLYAEEIFLWVDLIIIPVCLGIAYVVDTSSTLDFETKEENVEA